MPADPVRFFQVGIAVLRAIVHPRAIHEEAIRMRTLGEFHIGNKVPLAVRLHGNGGLRPIVEFTAYRDFLRRGARRWSVLEVVQIDSGNIRGHIDCGASGHGSPE